MRRVGVDRRIRGTYQSIGVMATERVVYRVITESVWWKKGVYVQEYQLRRGKVVPLFEGKTPRRLCSNHSLALPMLSKTGRLLGAFDLKSQTSKIFRVGQDPGKDCEELVNLGVFTGKMDFSYYDSMVAFHINEKRPSLVRRTMFQPSRTMDHLNAFLFRISERRLTRLSGCRASNCYYPTFGSDGSVTVLEQPFDGSPARFLRSLPLSSQQWRELGREEIASAFHEDRNTINQTLIPRSARHVVSGPESR